MKAAAGLAAALVCALLLRPIPPWHPFTGWELPARAAGYFMAIPLAAILCTLLVRGSRDLAIRTGCAAIWWAPLAVLITWGSAWVAIPLVVLVVCATPLFGLARDEPQVGGSELLRQLPSSFTAAVCIQSAAVAAIYEQRAAAAALISTGVALLVWRATALDPRPRLRVSRTILALVVALALTIVGMLPYQAVSLAAGSGGSGRAGGDDPPTGASADGIGVDESYRGVILFPEIEKRVTLVPPLPALSRDPFRENKNFLDIPFYGVFWFLRLPDTHPPKDSVEMRGTPAELTFRSHDSRPLVMEAHQNLGTRFDVTCCRAIQIAITNRDRFPGSVAVELILVDTFEPEMPFQSLGVLPVRSIWFRNGPAMAEVLDFPIPPSPTIRKFDEFTIRFHMQTLRFRESANIGIDRFVMKPR